MSISISGDGTFTGVSTNYSFDKSVSVGGTVTYEDVTSVDSIGIITARQGVVIGTGASIGNPANNELGLYTDSSERLHISSTGNIGIGTSGFTVNGKNLKIGSFGGGANDITRLELHTTSNSGTKHFSIGNNGSTLNVYDETADVERVAISTDGHVTTPTSSAVYMSCDASTPSISAGQPLQFNEKYNDRNNDYSTSTYLFTAPVTGYYMISAHVIPTNLTQNTSEELYFRINGSGGARIFLDRRKKTESDSNSFSVGGSLSYYLTKGTTVNFELNNGSNATLEQNSMASIVLLG